MCPLCQIWFLETRFRPGWPQTLRDPTASASLVLGLNVFATTARLTQFFLSQSLFLSFKVLIHENFRVRA